MWPLLAPKAYYGLGSRAAQLPGGERHAPAAKYSAATAANSQAHQARRSGAAPLHHPLASQRYGRVLEIKRQIPEASIFRTSGHQMSVTRWGADDMQPAQPRSITDFKTPRDEPEDCSTEKSEFQTCAPVKCESTVVIDTHGLERYGAPAAPGAEKS